MRLEETSNIWKGVISSVNQFKKGILDSVCNEVWNGLQQIEHMLGLNISVSSTTKNVSDKYVWVQHKQSSENWNFGKTEKQINKRTKHLINCRVYLRVYSSVQTVVCFNEFNWIFSIILFYTQSK